MYSRYRLNADELDDAFLQALKILFQNKTIQITVCEIPDNTQDETDYLMRSNANRTRLLTAINNIENSENLVTVALDEITNEHHI
jgi:antitoxin YefM